MASIARIPRGPNPRSRAASRSTEGLAPVLAVLLLLTHRRARPGAGHHARAADPSPGLGRIHPLHAGMRAEESHLGPQLHKVDAVRQGIERYGALVLARRRAHTMRAGCELDHEVGARGGAAHDLAVDRDAELRGAAKGTTRAIHIDPGHPGRGLEREGDRLQLGWCGRHGHASSGDEDRDHADRATTHASLLPYGGAGRTSVGSMTTGVRSGPSAHSARVPVTTTRRPVKRPTSRHVDSARRTWTVSCP